jgi:hypothetical protein
MAHRPDGRTPLQVISLEGSPASRRLFFNTQFPHLQCALLDHNRQSSGRLKSNRQFPSLMHTRPDHSCQTSGWSYLNCNSCLKEIRVRLDTTSSGQSLIFPFLELGKKSETDRVLGGVWTCCWNIRTGASWHRNFSIQYGVRTERTLRPNGWCWSV